MNTQTMANGRNKTSKNGNANPAKMSPTTITPPRIKMPIPANTKSRKIAAQNSAIRPMMSPAAPTAPLNGPTSSWPLMMIRVDPASKNNPPATMTSMTNASTIATFLAILRTFNWKSNIDGQVMAHCCHPFVLIAFVEAANEVSSQQCLNISMKRWL
jgi:hypothetical protein